MTRSLGARLLACLGGGACAVLLAMLAAHWYEPPNLMGSSGSSLWSEGDFLCSLASSLVAIGVAIAAGRAVIRVRAFGALVVRAIIWFGLTVLLSGAWAQFLSLWTLLIAPSHAFAVLRLALLWQAFRTDRAWRRLR